MDHLLGSVVLNYRLVEKLGAGGFGAVYRARHEELGREVAIKVLRSERADNADVVQRFLREAQLICQIGHASIVEIENAGRLPSGEPFYVMELVPGLSLAQRLSRIGPLTAREAAQVFAPIVEALAVAHDKGIIHRDLKPHNIMVEEQGGTFTRVKLLDFGIAKVLTMTEASLTGEVLGSPHFMAPEQAQSSRRATAASDVYSFAATLFNALTGQRPIDGDSALAVLLAAQRDPPAPLSRFARGVPPALDEALERCLAKDPAARPPSIRDAWTALRAALAEADGMEPITPTAVGDQSTATSAPSGSSGQVTSGTSDTPLAQEMVTPAPARRRRWWWSVPIAGAAAVAVLLFAITRPRAREPQLAPPPISADAAAPTTDAASAPQLALDAAVAPPAPDAAPEVVVDAGRPAPAPTSHRPRPRPDGVAPPPRPVPPDAGPELDVRPPIACDRASFAAVYTLAAPSKAEVRAAMARLRDCRGRGLISESEHTSIQAALVARLTPS